MSYELISVALAFACLFIILVAVTVVIVAVRLSKENDGLANRVATGREVVDYWRTAAKCAREDGDRVSAELSACELRNERMLAKCQTAGSMVAALKRRIGRADRCIERLKDAIKKQRDELSMLNAQQMAARPVFVPKPLVTEVHLPVAVEENATEVCPVEVYDLATEPITDEQLASVLRAGYGGNANVIMAGN